MKYRVGEPEKVTKDGKDYRVWKVSGQAGFYLADGVEGEAAEELIDRIIASCSALAVKMDAEACADHEPEVVKDAEAVQDTDADDATKAPGASRKKSDKDAAPKQVYLLRRRTDEKIVIDKDVFKLGKDASCVDYCISDNPTISRNHADIIRKKDSFFVKDKGSLNRTFVDGKKLEPDKLVKIEPGSLVQLADEVFELKQE